MKKEKVIQPFLKYILDRILKNKNCIIMVVGETGSGKSYSALRLAEALAEIQEIPFDVDNVAFEAEEFLKLLRKELPKGSPIVFDECGVAFQARTFMSFINRTLSYTLQTIRRKNHIIIMTVPDISFVDAQGRKLIHMMLITEKIIHSRKVARLRPYIISITYRTGKVYHIAPRVRIDGILTKIRKIDVHLPTIRLRHEYEKKKKKYTDKLYDTAYKGLRADREADLNVLSANHRTVYELDRAGMKSPEIAKILKVKVRRIYDLRKENKQAGFIPDRSHK